jgi:hypothetical protein
MISTRRMIELIGSMLGDKNTIKLLGIRNLYTIFFPGNLNLADKLVGRCR